MYWYRCRLDAGHCTSPCSYEDLPLVIVHFDVFVVAPVARIHRTYLSLAYIAPAVLATLAYIALAVRIHRTHLL